jgi:glycosyltransferase involved in cell wall biosynthesis
MLGNPVVNITIPVLNEEAQLESSVQKILGTVETLSLAVELVIADNGSTDRTQQIGERLAAELKGVYYCRLAEVGRGRAIKAVWMNSRAGVLSYMDVDLSTDLSCFNALITPVRTNTADLCIGSRLLKGSRVKRGIKREILSRGYNYSLQRLLHLQVRDAQCGFKAVTLNAAKELVVAIVL